MSPYVLPSIAEFGVWKFWAQMAFFCLVGWVGTLKLSATALLLQSWCHQSIHLSLTAIKWPLWISFYAIARVYISGQGYREISILSCVDEKPHLLIFNIYVTLCFMHTSLKILSGILFYFLIFNSISQFVYFKWQSFLFAFIVVIDILGLDSSILYMDFDF